MCPIASFLSLDESIASFSICVGSTDVHAGVAAGAGAAISSTIHATVGVVSTSTTFGSSCTGAGTGAATEAGVVALTDSEVLGLDTGVDLAATDFTGAGASKSSAGLVVDTGAFFASFPDAALPSSSVSVEMLSNSPILYLLRYVINDPISCTLTLTCIGLNVEIKDLGLSTSTRVVSKHH
jgi:hypothetical protein